MADANLPIPHSISQIIAEGDTAFREGQFTVAASTYRRVVAILAADPKAGTLRVVLDAQGALCQGLANLQQAEGHTAAKPHFEKSFQLFKSASHAEGTLRAEHYWRVCKALDCCLDGEIDDAIDNYIRSKACLKALMDCCPHEAKGIERLCVEIDIELAVLNLVDDITDGDFDGARSELANARRLQEQFAAYVKDENPRVFYKGYLLFAEGLWSYAQGKHHLEHFRLGDSRDKLKAALEKYAGAKEALDKSGPVVPKWALLRGSFAGSAIKCEGDLKAVDTYEAILQERWVDACKLAREAAEVYDRASAAFAEAGNMGFGGLYDAAEERDRLKSLADILSKKRLAQADAIPSFPTFVKDDALAKALTRDYREVLLAYQTGAWKLCIVGCGSVLETLLLYATQSNWPKVQATTTPRPTSGPEAASSWRLEELIDAASKAGLISRGVEHLSDALRDYRNLVHPSKEVRGKYAIDEGAAVTAMSAMDLIIKELRGP